MHKQLTRHVAKDSTALLWSGNLQRTAAATKLVSNLQQRLAVSAHYVTLSIVIIPGKQNSSSRTRAGVEVRNKPGMLLAYPSRSIPELKLLETSFLDRQLLKHANSTAGLAWPHAHAASVAQTSNVTMAGAWPTEGCFHSGGFGLTAM